MKYLIIFLLILTACSNPSQVETCPNQTTTTLESIDSYAGDVVYVFYNGTTRLFLRFKSDFSEVIKVGNTYTLCLEGAQILHIL
jgi:hypothetical protein